MSNSKNGRQVTAYLSEDLFQDCQDFIDTCRKNKGKNDLKFMNYTTDMTKLIRKAVDDFIRNNSVYPYMEDLRL